MSQSQEVRFRNEFGMTLTFWVRDEKGAVTLNSGLKAHQPLAEFQGLTYSGNETLIPLPRHRASKFGGMISSGNGFEPNSAPFSSGSHNLYVLFTNGRTFFIVPSLLSPVVLLTLDSRFPSFDPIE